MKNERQNRIELIGRVQVAYENLKDAMQRYSRNSAKVTAARHRLALLNRALAMMTLQSMQAA
jgi:hypothetical protein